MCLALETVSKSSMTLRSSNSLRPPRALPCFTPSQRQTRLPLKVQRQTMSTNTRLQAGSRAKMYQALPPLISAESKVIRGILARRRSLETMLGTRNIIVSDAEQDAFCISPIHSMCYRPFKKQTELFQFGFCLFSFDPPDLENRCLPMGLRK